MTQTTLKGGATSARRQLMDLAFQGLALLVLCIALVALGALIVDIWSDGASRLSWNFLTGFQSRRAADAGVWHALTGSVFVILVTGLISVPIGVAAAIYLEEYGGRSFAARIIDMNITNLAAVPSIIYGLLGQFADGAIAVTDILPALDRAVFWLTASQDATHADSDSSP